ncbi:TonB-dependent receptor [Hirschia litorea]|uniref:TonB-dependent receptor n=1 Tax=Hirschia litorea TaxID=1199156 RepID=A0ABW2INV3_9PROT
MQMPNSKTTLESTSANPPKSDTAVAGVLGLALLSGWAALPANADETAPPKDKERVMDTVHVDGQKVESSISTLTGPVEDIPQIINVIDQDLLKAQGVNTLEQALRNVPGITTDLGEGGVLNGDQFFIRGLSAKNDIFTDGLRDFGVFTRDSFNFEQVEVLKGSSSTTLGRGVTGGGINTSSKTPHLKNAISGTISAGTADYARFSGDWNQQLNSSTALRINAMVHENGVEGRDVINSKRWGFAPSIGFGLGKKTSFTLSYLHQEDDRTPDYGVGFYNNRPLTEYGIPSSNFYGYDSDTDESIVDSLTARFKHSISDNIEFTSDTKVGAYSRLFVQTINSCSTGADCIGIEDEATRANAEILTRSSPYDQNTWGVQNVSTLRVTSPLGHLENELLIGWDASYQSNERKRLGFDTTDRGRVPKSVLSPTHGEGPALGQVYRIEDTTGKDISIFIHDQLWFTEAISMVLGGRFNSYEVDQNRIDFTTPYAPTACSGTLGDNCLTQYASNTEFFNPKASLLWEPTEYQHYYISYSTSATPPGVTIANGTSLSSTTQDLDPEENKSYEIGAKIGLLGGNILLQSSIFKTEKDNAKETDPISGDITASGLKQSVEGIEIGLSGQATDALNISANYTYLNSTIDEYVNRSGLIDSSVTGNKTQYVPENAANVFVTYNLLNGPLKGLQIGGSVNYQSEVFLNTSNTQKLDGRTTMDSFIAYDFGNYRAALNINNLTDEDYFSQIHSSRVTPAAGRTAIASLTATF